MKKILLCMVMSVSFFGYGQIKSVIVSGSRVPVVIDLKNYDRIDTFVFSSFGDTAYYIKEIGLFRIIDNTPKLSTGIIRTDSSAYYYQRYLILKKRGITDSNNIYFKKLNSIKK